MSDKWSDKLSDDEAKVIIRIKNIKVHVYAIKYFMENIDTFKKINIVNDIDFGKAYDNSARYCTFEKKTKIVQSSLAEWGDIEIMSSLSGTALDCICSIIRVKRENADRVINLIKFARDSSVHICDISIDEYVDNSCIEELIDKENYYKNSMYNINL